MQINIRTFLFLLILALVSCSKEEEAMRHNAPVTVTIGSTPRIGIETRSTIAPDGLTVQWAKGDQLAVWARNSDGAYQFSAQPFVLWLYSETFDEAKFTATIDPMPEGKYDYFALTPMPQSLNGTRAVYSVPLVQTGVYDPNADIRIATPSLDKEPLTEGDNSASVSFDFVHKVHMLRIRIPENKLGQPIVELELTFPVSVVGKLTVDATDPDAAPVLSDGWNKLSIKPKEPLQAGDVVTAFIAPVEIPDTEVIEIRAYGETGGSRPAYLPGKNFAAGHTTPIALTVPTKERDYASIELSLTDMGEQTLGENISLFKISGPYDVNLGNGSSERLFFVRKAGEKYTFTLGRKFSPDKDNISGKTFKVTFESVNAVVTSSFVMPQIKDGRSNVIPALTVPYLFEEDFSTVTAFDHNGSNSGHNGSTAVLGGLANGWHGNQVQAQAGTSIRIKSRCEYAVVSNLLGDSYGSYRGRVTSPVLSNIRANRTLKVSISFNYSGATENSNFTPVMNFGYETQSSQFSGYWKNVVANKTTSSGGSEISTLLQSNVKLSTNGSFTNIPLTNTVILDNVSSNTRLSWDIDFSGKKGSSYFNLWLYLDNIKVKIVK